MFCIFGLSCHKFYPMYLRSYLLLVVALGLFSQAKAQSNHLVKQNLGSSQAANRSMFRHPNAVSIRYYQLDLNKLDQYKQVIVPCENETMTLQFERSFDYSNGASSWYGKSITGSGYGIFSFYQGAVSGKWVNDLNQSFILQSLNQANFFAVSLINNEGMQESDMQITDYIETAAGKPTKRANADVCDLANACSSPSVVDLMVLGNADAITNGGGSIGSFTANVASAITEMNTSLINGGLPGLSFNLVHCDLYAFSTTASSSSDLGTFASDVAVQALRNIHKADLVGLWVGSGSYGSCGIGYLNTAATNYNDNAAYTVSDYNCAMTNLTYAHECGHNMGLRHDWYVDGSTSPCDHHHGYVNQDVIPTGTPSSARWRTIMAYNNQCAANGFNCTRLPRWSNPSQLYLGDVIGSAIGTPEPSDEMFAFARIGCVVANFRMGIPTPVELSQFDAQVQQKNILLKWRTENEWNNQGFEIEFRHALSENYQSVDFIKGQGNSSLPVEYSHTLKDWNPGTYYFRLAQKDHDGKISHSSVIRLEVLGEKIQVQIVPNPLNKQGKMVVFSPKKQSFSWTISDLMGRPLIRSHTSLLESGRNEWSFSMETFTPGIYLMQFKTADEQQSIK
ncbi:MAG TPA: hypothetical protein DCF44_00360, partial [Chitinophagaceae bacterium]|nr:hypothetical protein [Chitinophagaceae bacterium]